MVCYRTLKLVPSLSRQGWMPVSMRGSCSSRPETVLPIWPFSTTTGEWHLLSS